MSEWIHIFQDAPVREFAKGDTVFRRNDPVKLMFLVRSGEIAMERPLADGGNLTLHVATEGTALAEASLFANSYHCDAVARTDARVAVLSRRTFTTALRNSPDAAMSMVETHAKAVQAHRARIEILRMRQVADRLDAWLDLYGEPLKGEWIKVANQIGVSPPALYRELARRRR
ncbi:Crp/Fnr family transcriptional regulator [Loktanella sp. SALINAS62]|uniref:Crp/Fnr family transcriptional regulator n=1 Tax=Loktanella sp. SALINAS62 TaxID=2706124 RepID=UPI001B8B421B|nr:Crp/Fnr family transcriptional regulator [Loktanella sp. SALINAS62]MBS1304077.1 Crp/Fnr family transcriptional regulator [Loktanella sp. SALINAS62]